MQYKVMMAFDDPGGGLAVTSLLERLRQHEIDLEIYCGKLSEKFLEKENRVYNKIDSMITREYAAGIMQNVRPDLLITGTGGGNAEQELRNEAFQKNIKSIVILDFWKDYARRWLYASYSLSEMRDKICVMDEFTKDEMTGENFPEGNIIVTGHPYLDKIFNFSKNNSGKNNFRKNHILFLSQPLHIIGLKDYKIHPLKTFLESLKRMSSENKSEYSLNIKLHPSEEMSSEIEELKKTYDSEYLRIKFADKSSSLKDMILESEIITGYNTIAMFESRAMNRRTISLKVAPIRNSLSIAMKTAGIEVINADEVSIIECINNSKPESYGKEIFKGGIDNCIKLILSELNLN